MEEADLFLINTDGSKRIDVQSAHFDILNAALAQSVNWAFVVLWRAFWTDARIMLGFALEEIFIEAGKVFCSLGWVC